MNTWWNRPEGFYAKSFDTRAPKTPQSKDVLTKEHNPFLCIRCSNGLRCPDKEMRK